MLMTDLIVKKRDGGELSHEEINFMIDGYTRGQIPDYQMSAMCMAILLRGMSDRETLDMTMAMVHSGETLDLSPIQGVKGDKHSTGGVGDKTSLVLCPMVAACGLKVAKMSGRGLGHTGGTIDKLESFPGFTTGISEETFFKNVNEIGIAIAGQTADLVPADKKLYALRDVTATIDSLPLITSSIMSKKLAAGSHSIVLDVKIGSGAFMKTLGDGRRLAENMVAIGKACGRNVTAVMTNMDIPLGNYIGNALEVIEAAQVLQGRGCEDLRSVCRVLASNMLVLCNGWELAYAEQQVDEAVASGAAFAQMKRCIAAQGGDASVLDDVTKLPQASVQYQLKAPRAGYIQHMDTQLVGEASAILGAGRKTKEDSIDFAAGIVLQRKTGDFVEEGQTLAVLHTNRADTLPDSERVFLRAITFGDAQPEKQPLVYGIVR